MVSVRYAATRWSLFNSRTSDDFDGIPWWTVFAAICAPLVLIGGWTAAADAQPRGSYDWTEHSISALGSASATDRWIMTVSFVIFGLCQVVTALGLRMLRSTGRMLLTGAGVAAMMLAVVPAPAVGGSMRHASVAGVASVLLAIWMLFAFGPDQPLPWFLRPRVRAGTVVTMLLLIVGYLVALQFHARSGVVERLSAGTEALWLALVVRGLRGPGPKAAALEGR